MDYPQPTYPDYWANEPAPKSSTPNWTQGPNWEPSAPKLNTNPQTINKPLTIQQIRSQGQAAPKLLRVDGTEFYRPIPLKENILDPSNYLRTAPDIPKPSIGQQVGSGALKAANVAGITYGGFIDYQSGIAQGESQFRSGTNAIAGMGGAYAGGAAGGQLGATAVAAVGSFFGGIGAVPGAIIGGFGGSIVGSIAGSGLAGWASDRFLDLFGGPQSTPNPNVASGNPFSSEAPLKALQIPQPTGQQLGAPPGSGSGMGMPKTAIPTDPSAGNPLFPLLPWLPEWKFPRMPWDPQAPDKPDQDPKKPAKPGNPGGPKPGSPVKPKPGAVPIKPVSGLHTVVITNKSTGVQSSGGVIAGLSTDTVFRTTQQRQDGGIDIFINLRRTGETASSAIGSAIDHLQTISYSFVATPTPQNTNPKDGKPPTVKPENPWPRPQTQPPDNSRPGTPDPGFPGNFSPPSFAPPVLPFLPTGIPPQPQSGYLGNPPMEGINPGHGTNPPSQPGANPNPAIPDANPTGKSPATNPQTAPSRSPAAREAPTLQPAQSQSPTANSPKIRTPGETPKGDSTTSYKSPTFDQWVKNNPPPWNNPENVAPTAQRDIKIPSTTTAGSNPFSSQNTGFTKPSANIPANIPVPAAIPIPGNAIAQPIISPGTDAPSTSCNYKPDATITVGLASYNPLTDSITYTPTLVSASNAAGFQHLAQETANMRKEVSGIHKVLEVDLYRSPTGKVVAPKAEVEVLQTVMSASPMAAVPLIKTLPQEMKVLAAMNHMYSGHHLLGNIKVSSNPANPKASTYAPLTAVGMQFALYNNVTSMIGLPNSVSTVNAKGLTVATPFLNSLDAIENVSATTQGLETDISGIQEMLFKVLQNQEMAINMIHKETFKTEVLIKDTGCRITEIPVQRPSVMSHGNAKTPVKKGFNWLNVFTGSKTYTNVPVWRGDIDKQQLGLKTNMEAQKANTSVYFPIADKEQTKLPNLQTRPKKGNEFNRFVKTLNEDIPGNSDSATLYDGPGLPKSKLEEIIIGNVKKIVSLPDTEFIGANPPLAGVQKGKKIK